jgi:hypothetical protein
MKQLLLTKPDGSKHFAGINSLKDQLKINSLAAENKRMTIQTVEVEGDYKVKQILETHVEAQAVVFKKEKDSLIDENQRLREMIADLQKSKAKTKSDDAEEGKAKTKVK